MKNKLLNLITGSLALMCSVSFAQPTLTATGINPVIGESFTYNSSDYVSEGSPGANQTWNLAAMSGSSAGLTNVVTPASTAHGSSFPNANIAWNNTTAATASYYKTSSAALQNYGVFGSNTVIPYSDPEDILHFPCTYNSTYSDSWAAQFVSGGYTFYRTGTTTVTADGYGTLITPVATYTNVMRIHFVQDYRDSAYVDGDPYILLYNNDEYMWYKEGVHIPIASMFTFITSMGSSDGGMYLAAGSGIDDSPDLMSSINLFPNPASDKIEITVPDNSEIEILNIEGQIFKSISTTDTHTTIDISGFARGVYFVKVKTDNSVAIKKFIKE